MKKLLYLFILIIPVFLFGFNPISTFASSPTELKEELILSKHIALYYI